MLAAAPRGSKRPDTTTSGVAPTVAGDPAGSSRPSRHAKPPAKVQAPAHKQATNAKKRPVTTHLIPAIPYHGQVFTEDCETAALQMALAHEGIRVTQRKLLKTEGLSTKSPVVGSAGKVVRWGDPNTSFVGHPNSASISTYYGAKSGYGTYAPNIARVASRFGATVLWQGTGFTRKQLENAIANDHPVIAWVGDRDGHMLWSPLSTWKAWDGKKVVYPTPSSGVYEHTVLIAGFGPRGVYVDDPLNGARNGSNINPTVGPGWVSWKSFLAGFRTFHGMAVELQ